MSSETPTSSETAIVVYQPFNPRTGNVFQLAQRFSSVRDVEGNYHRVVIEQKPGVSVGAVLWDAALVLGDYLQNEKVFSPQFFVGKRVLELGSGTGYLAMVAALQGASVVATDLDGPLIPLIRENVEKVEASIGKQLDVKVRPLAWGADNLWPSEDTDFDLVIASDVVYAEYAFPLLAETLTVLAERNSEKRHFEILLGYKKRYEKELKFFHLLKRAGFTWTIAPKDQLLLRYQHTDNFVYRIRKATDES